MMMGQQPFLAPRVRVGLINWCVSVVRQAVSMSREVGAAVGSGEWGERYLGPSRALDAVSEYYCGSPATPVSRKR